MATGRAAVLVCDDEPLIRDTLAEFLANEGFAVEAVGSGEEAARRAAERFFDVVLCDVNLPGIDGIEALQRGAQDYLMKPILLDEVLGKIRRLLKLRELNQENQWLRRQLHQAQPTDAVVGHSSAMAKLYDLARRVAPTKSTVLIQGESGTGKEVLARYIHEQAKGERFVAVNCAAIPNDLLENQLFGHRKGAFTGADRDSPGVFVHAGEGTVFLDEIAELPLATQAKLLRAIEQKEVMPVGANEPVRVEARIIAATNKSLAERVEAGLFRDDLFYRLNVVTLKLPPLRDRREDIPELVEFLLAKHARTLNKPIAGVSHEAMRLLIACPWKGNVRELDNALQRAVILGDGPLVTPMDLPPDLAPVVDDPSLVDDLSQAVKRFERRHIERVLRQSPDKKEAAKRLGIGLSSLYRKIDELNVEVP
jgi:DNA-binding NtrC family response regulator